MMTGDEYRASLDDGRATFFEGEQVFDLPGHPVLGITVDSAAAGYDRFYNPAAGAVGAFMAVPGSAKELREQVELHESVDLLTHVTYASIMTLLTAADRIEAKLPDEAQRIRAWVKDAQQRDVRITQCITDAKGDRSRRPGNQDDPDAYVRVIERRPDGIVIRGAKLHISAASMGHELMTIPTKSMKPGEDQYSVACMVPVGGPGVKIINTTYAPRHADTRDFPMSGNHHTPEGFVIFDDVFRAQRAGLPSGRAPGIRRRLRPLPRALGAPRGLGRLRHRLRPAGGLRPAHRRSQWPGAGGPHQGKDQRHDDQRHLDSGQPRSRHRELQRHLRRRRLSERALHQRRQVPWRSQLRAHGAPPARHRRRQHPHRAGHGGPGQRADRPPGSQVHGHHAVGGRHLPLEAVSTPSATTLPTPWAAGTR